MHRVNKIICCIFFLIQIFNSIKASDRVDLISLTSDWKMRDAATDKWVPATIPGCVHTDLLRNKLIPDPYYRTNEFDLQWIDKKDWEYKTTIDFTERQMHKDHIELVFKGLDTFADVYLNNQKILSADNMFCEWVVNAKPLLKVGQNELRIYFHSPINKGLSLLKAHGYKLKADNDQALNGGLQKDELVSPFIRKAPYHFGWDWGPRFVTLGIWKPVFLREWNNVLIEDLFVEQLSLSDKQAKLNGQLTIQSTDNQTVNVKFFVGNRIIARKKVDIKSGANNISIPFVIEKPRRWWTNGLGEQYLYKITASVTASNSGDTQSREIGLRTLRLVQNSDSAGHSFYFELNGVPVFAKGENHIPNDMFLDRVTKEVYDWEIETAVNSNLNMLRVWGGGVYEDDYFYEQCDRKGILVWQDFMFACSLYPANNAFLRSITAEASYQIKRLRNHPSIAIWCGNNEIDVAWQNYSPKGGWGWKNDYNERQKREIWAAYDTIFKNILPGLVKHLAQQTPYWHSSPASYIDTVHSGDSNPSGDVHYWGVWGGGQRFESYSDNIGRFMSEYGFQSFPELETVKKYALPEDYDIESEVMRHHQRSWIGNGSIKKYMNWYYRMPTDFEKFLYVGQVLQAYGIGLAIESHRRAMPYNMGSLVWQINDCWPVASWSSSDYFHRWKALQYEIKREFEPVLISAYPSGEHTKISIVSDERCDVSANLEVTVCNFEGKILLKKTVQTIVKATAVTPVFEEKTNTLTQQSSISYMTMRLKSNNQIIAEKTYFFDVPKNLNLTKPNIVSTIEKRDSKYIITLETDVLAKDVYLNFPDTEGFFSDNYFDLLPNRTCKIIFTPKDKRKQLPALKIMSLQESY